MRSRRKMNLPAAELYGVTLPGTSEDDKCLSPNEAARILGVTGENIKQYIYKRRLPAVKLPNGYWKIKKSDFEKFIRARMSAPESKVLVFAFGTSTDAILRGVEKSGRTAMLARSASDALLKINDEHPVAVVIELSTDAASGWKLAQSIRRSRMLVSLPILLVTELVFEDRELEKALDVGARAVLTAPVAEDLVAIELSNALRSS